MDRLSKELNVSYFATIWSAVASVGWYALAVIISLWWAFPYIQEKYVSWKLRRNQEENAVKHRKRLDLLEGRISALEASRQRAQEEYQAKCLLVQRQKEEERGKMRNASISVSRDKLSYDDRSSPVERRHKSMKGEYNPLNGDGYRGYRSPKRSCCGKGSCG